MALPTFRGINEKDNGGRRALHHAEHQGLGMVTLAIMAHPNFDAWAEAEFIGGMWPAMELAVSSGHTLLA